jgi:hypothetical protein
MFLFSFSSLPFHLLLPPFLPAVDASALDHLKQIADFCKKEKVQLCLSGSEAHLNILEHSGIFKKENRFADLDASLCFCEDQLLRKYNICENSDFSDGENEEKKLRNEIQILKSKKTVNDDNKNINCNDNDDYGVEDDVNMSILDRRIIEINTVESIMTIEKDIIRKENEIKQITRKGFLKCLEMMQNRLNISDESMSALTLLCDHVKPVTLKEGDVVMHTTQGSPVHMDADGLYFIQVSGGVWWGVIYYQTKIHKKKIPLFIQYYLFTSLTYPNTNTPAHTHTHTHTHTHRAGA